MTSIEEDHYNRISEKAVILDKVCDLLCIGENARRESVVLSNIQNIERFADYLRAIEQEFFMVPGDPDEDYPYDEPEDVCLVNSWGSSKEDYIEQFRSALQIIKK